MITVGELTVAETGREYAVEIDGVLYECEDLDEAKLLSNGKIPILTRQVFVMEWETWTK